MTSGSSTDALEELRSVFDGPETYSEPLTTVEVADALGCSRRTAYNRLDRLAERGELSTKKVGARGRIWWRPLRGPDARTSGGIAKRREEHYRIALENLTDTVFVTDDEGAFTFVCPNVHFIFGYTADEVAEMGTVDALLGENPISTEGLEETGERSDVERTVTDKAGDEHHLWITVRPVSVGDGAVLYVCRDVTDRTARERELRRERELVERIFETSPIGLGIVSHDGGLERTNARAEAMTESLADEVIEGCDLRDVEVYDADGSPVPFEERPTQRARKTGEPVYNAELAVDRDGERTWFSVNAAPLPTRDGEPDRTVVAAEDVTERKERTRRLKRQRDDLRRELEDAFDRVDDAFFGVDDRWRFTYANERAEDLLEKTEAELIGDSLWKEFPESVGSTFEEEYARAMRTQRPVTFEEYYEPLGAWFEVRAYPSETGLSVYFHDVTERKTRERALEESEQRYRTLAEHFPNGGVALFDEELRYTLLEGSIFDEAQKREAVGERAGSLSPDPETREKVVRNYRAALDGETNTYAFDLGERSFRAWTIPVIDGDDEVFAGMVMTQDVTERKRRERQLERQRERLAALVNVNGVVREINEALVGQSTREEIERVVCERLASSESYRFAWICEIDPRTQSVRPRVEAGVDGYLDEIPLSVDPGAATGRGPAGRAAQTGEMQIVRDAFADPDFEPWREHAREYGYRSVAVIPIVHEGTLYGLLGVYAARSGAFADEERAVVGQLGELVGHAIAAIERKRALMGDDVVEIEFRLQNVLDVLGISTPAEGTVTFDSTVPVGDGTFLEYGTTDDDAIDALEALVERLPHWEDVSVLRREFGDVGFELRLADPPVVSVVTSHGGYVDEAAIEDGDYRMTVHLPPSADVRSVVDTVGDAYPDVETVTQRRVSRSEDFPERVERTVAEDLTERQRAALEAAFHSGFFEWPRDNSGEAVADSLGVCPSTFHQHVRLGERKLLAALFGESE
ncbi:bacterio-opsin activator domain-containing protein [Halegenticoccus tardaugens]|uniref:bacterio-opsin activator domain-containing protein n=1 Tax=Halegenticoccus tardaugens TaxID=2071624 RepID=UPI0013E97412|nr:bacterio-opsin activator domain-containing protein [Halegenticoccus tardaugens]